MSDKFLRQDFDGCVKLYKELVNSQTQTIGSRYVLQHQVQTMPVETRVLHLTLNTTTMTQMGGMC